MPNYKFGAMHLDTTERPFPFFKVFRFVHFPSDYDVAKLDQVYAHNAHTRR